MAALLGQFYNLTECNIVPSGAGSLKICQEGTESGIFFPLGGGIESFEHGLFSTTEEGESMLRAVFYLILLLYCFLGVGIIADLFMGAIEAITSKKVVTELEGGKTITGDVWNGTVANLSLMALGSSAPEILLNVIGIFPNFQASELGPSTIVGSAAFNLLMIIAVCILAIPDNGVRKIKNLQVYSITATFSVLAYVWLYYVLAVSSPDVVTLTEGVLTFASFFVLIIYAYLADTMSAGSLHISPEAVQEELAEMEAYVRGKYGKNRFLTEQETAILMKYEFPPNISRAVYRSQAIKSGTGGGNLKKLQEGNEKAQALVAELVAAEKEMRKAQFRGRSRDLEHSGVKVGFVQAVYTVMESVGTMTIKVKATGNFTGTVKAKYETRNGTALAGDDYEESGKWLTFSDKEREQEVSIKIVPSKGHEKTEYFYVDLVEATNCSITVNTTCVTIIDEGDAIKKIKAKRDGNKHGEIRFMKESMLMKAPQEATEDIPLKISVARLRGKEGKVECKWTTQEDSAVAGKDFVEDAGILTFEEGEEEKEITVFVKPNTAGERDEIFRVILSDISGGATFDDQTDGGDEEDILTIIIEGEEARGLVALLPSLFDVNWDRLALGNQTYCEQFSNAWYVNGSPEEAAEATCMDYILHILSLPWKLVFAIVPPTQYCGGWLSFCISLFMIGVVTCIIGDLAEIVGCSAGISSSTTAITVVALGTSLPDTFASKTAAQWEPTADNSIGNVTGSNSVNVFLGLGLPWFLCCLYWSMVDCGQDTMWWKEYGHKIQSIQSYEFGGAFHRGAYVVPAGALGTSVGIFSVCAIIALAWLALRRSFVGGELGGNIVFAYISSGLFAAMWVLYIVLSIVLGRDG